MKYDEVDFAKMVASQDLYPEIFGRVETKCVHKNKRMRIDIETDEYAYECKFGANAWKSAIGQALSYAMLVKKKAGIVVFIRTNPRFHDNDKIGYEILMKAIEEYDLPITVRRFYVSRKTGQISKNNTIKWEEEDEETNKRRGSTTGIEEVAGNKKSLWNRIGSRIGM